MYCTVILPPSRQWRHPLVFRHFRYWGYIQSDIWSVTIRIRKKFLSILCARYCLLTANIKGMNEGKDDNVTGLRPALPVCMYLQFTSPHSPIRTIDDGGSSHAPFSCQTAVLQTISQTWLMIASWLFDTDAYQFLCAVINAWLRNKNCTCTSCHVKSFVTGMCGAWNLASGFSMSFCFSILVGSLEWLQDDLRLLQDDLSTGRSADGMTASQQVSRSITKESKTLLERFYDEKWLSFAYFPMFCFSYLLYLYVPACWIAGLTCNI